MPDRIVLTIGTKKGVFVADAPSARDTFTLQGPFGPGIPVYATLIDTRGTPRLYASSCNPFFGMKVLRSTNLGKSFEETKSAPAFSKEDGRALVNIWAIEPGDGEQDLLCGVEPAALFRSRDSGDSWEVVPGISDHGRDGCDPRLAARSRCAAHPLGRAAGRLRQRTRSADYRRPHTRPGMGRSARTVLAGGNHRNRGPDARGGRRAHGDHGGTARIGRRFIALDPTHSAGY